MVHLGYKLSAEEHPPDALIQQARRAEDVGFEFAMISDHYHPWTDRQGQSPFVWAVLGAIARETSRLRVGTGVTCPTVRIHPAIIAHAAATITCLMPGRFLLGLGSGENLNEHIVGRGWPEPSVRHEMLAEAIEVIRLLWKGGVQSHRGRHFTVENARVYTLPDAPPPILVAASGAQAAELAGQAGDGLIAVAADKSLVESFTGAGGARKPRYAEAAVCWAADEAQAKRTALEWWPLAAVQGTLFTELPLPEHIEQAAALATEEHIAKAVVCGPDPERHLEEIKRYVDAGFDHIWVHQVGPDQEGFFRFYEREIIPKLS